MTEARQTYKYEDAFKQSVEYFGGEELPAKVFLDKYALRDNDLNLLEATPNDMHHRLAKEFARIELKKFKNPMNEDEIYHYFKNFKYIVPGGSGLSGIGNKHKYVSLSNCFVGKSPLDSYSSICKTDEEIVSISKRRGGIGFDISNLRPSGTPTSNASNTSTGIVPFCERYSNTIREVGQCLHGSTMILTFDGLKTIDSIEKGEQVWTKEGWVLVNNIVNNTKPCVKVKTKHGKEIICSKDHIFHTIEGEKSVKKMKVGDPITQIIGHGWYGDNLLLKPIKYKKHKYNNSNRLDESVNLPKSIDENFAYFLGYSYGDGGLERQKNGEYQAIGLASANAWPDIKDKLINTIKETFNYEAKIKKVKNSQHEVIRTHSRYLIEFLKINNILKQKAGQLIFPKIFFNLKEEVVFSFLSGYFDADGCVLVSKKSYKFSSIDKEFLLAIQTVLASFGIVSKIHETSREKYGWNDIYDLTISGNKSQDIFIKLMKQSIKVKTLGNFSKKRDYTKTIYTVRDFATISSRHSYLNSSNKYISYSSSQRLLQDLDLEKDINLLQDNILSIEEYDNSKDNDVYDLCLDKEHLFFANGLYAHNSGRRGALILTISVHHPEIINFITMKQDLQKINGANISVRLTDEFLNAVEKNEKYEQRWPVDSKEPTILNMVDAKEIWDEIIKSSWKSAEPGILMWNNIIRESPADCYPTFQTTSTNPCSELPLSERDSCRLLLLNLYSFVDDPFTKKAKFNFDKFYKYTQVAQRFMDNLIDMEIENIDNIINKIKADPEPIEIKRDELSLWKSVKKSCQDGRRTGTGLNAIGDTIAACGYKYGSKKSINLIDEIFKTLKLGCYRSSVDMAKEIGAFKVWDHELEKNNPFLLRIKDDDEKLWKDMKKYGRRNIGLLTMAPSGSVSILTQTTSGIEPLFQISYIRRKKININDENVKVDFIDDSGDRWQNFEVTHPKVKVWKATSGEEDISKSPWYGCCAEDINWEERIDLQARANKNIDHSISSTLNLPENATIEDISKIYKNAWKKGVKGITVYRKNCRTGVLIDKNQDDKNHIIQNNAPKRPIELPGDIHHVSVKGNKYFVLVGVLNGHEPYEIFAGHKDIEKLPKQVIIKKKKRNTYCLMDTNTKEVLLEDMSKHVTDEEEALTRMISLSLRHGADINFITHQLEKTSGDMLGFAKAVSRVLKKYILEGSMVHGENCPDCGGELRRQEGCLACSCGFSKCG